MSNPLASSATAARQGMNASADKKEAREFFENMAEHTHEQVVYCCDRDAGPRSIIAIFDTTLGALLDGSGHPPPVTARGG